MPSLAQALGARATRNEPLSRHTTARIGGPADLYIEALTSEELRDLVLFARQHGAPCIILGSGSNVLVSDAGIRGLVIANKARNFKFKISNLKLGTLKPKAQSEISNLESEIYVWAESGVVLPTLARECIERGYANLEWAVGVPGTLGGAVAGNAGAHGGNVARDLVTATILDANGIVRDWANQELEFDYRTSKLKSGKWQAESGKWKPVVLAATFRLQPSTREELEARAAQFTEQRRRSQPPGATMGSMFKNPPGDYAGRLIEAAGLKGTRIGNARISTVHANFFVNLGGATAADVQALIDLARKRVQEQFGVELELEIELIG